MGMDIGRATYVHPMDFEELGQILVRFNLLQKLLCPFIYNELSDRCYANFFTDPRADKRDVQEPSIPALLDNFQASLEWLVSKHPDLMDRPEWQVNVNEEIASPVYRIRLPIVALLEMEQKVKQAIQPLTRSWVRYEIEPPANITRHLLLTLDREEMNFLPLWAGGLNDGTGAVFESHIPSTDMGPNGPGPAYHAGHTIPSAPPSISDSLVDDIFAMKVTSTPTSGTIDSHDDMSIVYRDDKAIVDDVSIKTESFQTAESDYDGARFAVPAGHQEIAETVNSLVEAVDDFEADTQETPVASDYESDSDGSVVLVKRACGE